MQMVFAWCVHDVDMVCSGVEGVRGRGPENFCMVCAWCVHGVCMVCAWCVHGVGWYYQRFSPKSVICDT